MIVTVIDKVGLTSITLPTKVKGQFWLYDKNDKKVVSIEAIEENWHLKSNNQNRIFDKQGNEFKTIQIKISDIYIIKQNNGERKIIFIEPITNDRQTFNKYLIKDGTSISIGRFEQNDIFYKKNVISSNHAQLEYKDKTWHIKDLNSKNGTFVNDEIVTTCELKYGDTVYIMGLKIIVGKNLIALNNPDGQVQISSKFTPFIAQLIDESIEEDEEFDTIENSYFYRSPRFKRDIKTATFKIDSPPSSPLTEEMPLILVLGTSLAMGMMSVVTLSTAIANKNIPSMIMGGSMLIGTVFMPMITKKYEKTRNKKKEDLRQKKYREYLNKMDSVIYEECVLQKEILNENNISIQECESRILNEKRTLWEREIGQNDFLKVRLGYGEGTLDAKISCSEKKFSINEDNLEEEMLMLAKRQNKLKNIPITYSILDDYVSGIIGNRNKVKEFAKGLLIQIASLYSYDEVKIVFLCDEGEYSDFEFVKWLPHVWSEENKFRMIATNKNEIKELAAYLERIVEERLEMNSKDLEETKPYYIIFSMSRRLGVRFEIMNKVLNKKENIHFSIITLYEMLRELPKECTRIVELNETNGKLYDKNDISGKNIEFIPDIYLDQNPMELSCRLANTYLDTENKGYTLPKMITFLELFGVGKVEHLNALTRWKENDPTKTLEAEVGVDSYGEVFKLDLHEKFHGPHGLVAGMTGSGKSEFIITYILSLAVNYHPDEVAFILIDYKGGGMAKSFEKLPHTVGIITNLDGAAIKRSLVSIESELKRRQAIFATASKKVGVSNIDIYKYQKLYREGAVSEPLQHLFIISDEFAELKVQQPEFMTQLVSAARIGRSLGVHLILATQKPSGVVDDQIWSNSRFRVCLKVQERADSIDMLKRPDAAELMDTGRFYLQVGYNELFELGQSAWSGAPYYPSEKVKKEKDESISVIDINGHTLKSVKISSKQSKQKNINKQLDVITEYLRDIAEEEHIKVRPLWLDPIPAIILMEEIKEKYKAEWNEFELNPVIGEYDDPARQRQCVLRLPISKEGNTIVYGVSGSGKTTFLNAMIYSLIHEHTPDEVNLYILDFGSETLKAFEKAPHVGEVLLSYESEKIINLFKMLYEEMYRRKKLFINYGGDYQSYIQESAEKLPSIVVSINNFAAFSELYEEQEEIISLLSREGTKYGIYFVLTSVGSNGVRFRLVQNFKQFLVFQLNDETEYSTIVGKTEGLVPSKCKGRGLIRLDSLYEFQIASLTKDTVPYKFIKKDSEDVLRNWRGNHAKRVPILPEKVTIDFVKDYIEPDNVYKVPIGVDSNSMQMSYFNFDQHYINVISSSGLEYQNFVSSLSSMMVQNYSIEGFIFDMTHELSIKNKLWKVCITDSECETRVAELFEIVLYRNNTYKDALEKGEEVKKFPPLIVIINGLISLRSSLSDLGKEKLSLILEKGNVKYGISIVVADQIQNISSMTFDKWYKEHVISSEGIWIGNGISEQYQMKPARMASELREEIPIGFGYVLNKGKYNKVKFLNEKGDEIYE